MAEGHSNEGICKLFLSPKTVRPRAHPGEASESARPPTTTPRARSPAYSCGIASHFDRWAPASRAGRRQATQGKTPAGGTSVT
jgi:hypothetical protein